MELRSFSDLKKLMEEEVLKAIQNDVQFKYDLANFDHYTSGMEQGDNAYDHHYSTCVFPLEGAYVFQGVYTEHPNLGENFEEKLSVTVFTNPANDTPSVIFARQNHLCKYEYGICEEVRKYGLVDGTLFSTFELSVRGEEMFGEREHVVRTIGELFSKNCYSIIKRVKEYDTWSIEYIIYGDKVYVTVTKKVVNKQDPEKVGYLVTEKYETLMAKVIDYSFAELDELFNPFNKEDRTRNIGANGSGLEAIGRILSYYPEYI